MINSEQLTRKVMFVIESTLDRTLNDDALKIIDMPIKMKLLNEINNSFKKAMGDDDFAKFCSYLNESNIQLYVENQGYNVTVCFKDDFVYYKVADIINKYYSSRTITQQ